MARPFARRSSCRNPSPTGKDRLAGATPGPAPIEGNNTSIPARALSRVLTPIPPVTLFVASSPAPTFAVALATAPSLNNELFK